MAVRHDLADPIWRGDTFLQPFVFKEAGAAMSLEGKTVVFTLKLNPTVPDDQAPIKYEVEVPNPDTEGANGEHTVVLQKSQTATLELASYTYQLKLITPSSPEDTEITYLYGRVSVKDS